MSEIMEKIRQEIIRNKLTMWIKKNVSTEKKQWIIAAITTIIFIIIWSFLPKNFSLWNSSIKYLLMIDCFLSLSIAIKVKMPEKWQGYLAFFLIMISPAVNIFNAEYVVQNEIRSMNILVLTLTYALCLLVYLILYVITHRIRITILIGMVMFTLFGLCNSFITEFRGNGIRAADIYAIKTAMNVAGGYKLVFNEYRATAILLGCCCIFLSFHCRYLKKGWKSRIPVSAFTLVVIVVLQNILWNNEFMEENEIVPYIWELATSAKNHGAILEFVAGVPYLKIQKPDKYSKKKVKEELEECDNANSQGLKITSTLNGKKPDIIAIMNESYSDLSVLGDFDTDLPYMEYYNSLSENTLKGMVSVPVWGGSTCNSEFEFMTGYSNVFFPAGIIPYENYINKKTHNLNESLKSQGYYSIFMHPTLSSGWNRKNVYASFDFNEQVYIEDYTYSNRFRDLVTDSSNYKELIKRYEEAKKENDNVFIFNVTMQNHGGYATGAETTVHLRDLQGSYPEVEEYLTAIKMSDEALEELITYFEQKEDPVVICMFGDHQPALPEAFYEEIQGADYEEDFLEVLKRYQTPFLIYTNYDIEEKSYENISANYLNTLLTETAGLETTNYQKYLENLYENYPVINAYGVKSSDGNWHEWTQVNESDELKDYEMVQYEELFDNK